MTDEFYDRFGQVEIAPKDTRRPNDGFALYERGSNVKRYDLDELPDGSCWGIDSRTGERAFRIDQKHRYFLPDGRPITAPKPLPPPKVTDAARRLYQQPSTDRARRTPTAKPGLAQRLYAKRGQTRR